MRNQQRNHEKPAKKSCEIMRETRRNKEDQGETEYLKKHYPIKTLPRLNSLLFKIKTIKIMIKDKTLNF